MCRCSNKKEVQALLDVQEELTRLRALVDAVADLYEARCMTQTQSTSSLALEACWRERLNRSERKNVPNQIIASRCEKHGIHVGEKCTRCL